MAASEKFSSKSRGTKSERASSRAVSSTIRRAVSTVRLNRYSNRAFFSRKSSSTVWMYSSAYLSDRAATVSSSTAAKPPMAVTSRATFSSR